MATNKYKIGGIYLTEEQWQFISNLAKVRTISSSAVIRQIIDDFINSTKKGV